MRELSWDLPKTEEGLQQILLQLEECRAEEDYVQIGNCLLMLSFFVKWVRSDTDAPSLVRSQELAFEAVSAFRKANSGTQLLRALIHTASFVGPKERQQILLEVEKIAAEKGGQNLVAGVFSSNARLQAKHDPVLAAELSLRALAIFRKLNKKDGVARCLSSLSYTAQGAEERRDFALEAAAIYREIDDFEGASMCVSTALRNAEEFQALSELEDIAKIGLQDSVSAVDRHLAARFCEKLSQIMFVKGNLEDAEQYRRQAEDHRNSDVLTPLERSVQDIEDLKVLIASSKSQGNKWTETYMPKS